jgi:hypothetical protein
MSVRAANEGCRHRCSARSTRRSKLGPRYRHRHSAGQAKLIFEAFQQADGTTSRKLVAPAWAFNQPRDRQLGGGELQVRSVPGEGSTFTLYVPPQSFGAAGDPQLWSTTPWPTRRTSSAMRRPTTGMAQRHPFVLIVEDDPTFARCCSACTSSD